MRPKIILDTRRSIKTRANKGRFQIKIAVRIKEPGGWKTFRGETKVYATEEEFEKLMNSPKAKVLQEKRDAIDPWFDKAKELCKIPRITKNRFDTLYYSAGNFESITGLFDYQIGEMEKEDAAGNARDGNAIAYRNAKSFFVRFKGGEYISYAEITEEWLNECKKWALTTEMNGEKVIRKAIKPTSFYIYVRGLRAIMNLAEGLGKIEKNDIPFGKGRFKIPGSKPGGRKVKIRMSRVELQAEKQKVLNHVSEDARVNKALNYWRISFFCNGCNMADIAYLRFKDYQVEFDEIEFQRKKTQNTEEDNETILVYVGERLKELIRIEGNKVVGDPEAYLFPILKRGMTSKQRKTRIGQFVQTSNDYLRLAKKEMDFKGDLTTGTARYWLGTFLKRNGIDLSSIGSLYGHDSEKTTEHYADDHDIDFRKSVYNMLVS